MVYRTERLGPAVDSGKGHPAPRDFGAAEHPVEEFCRQEWHIHGKKKIERMGACSQRRLDAAEGTAPWMHIRYHGSMG